MLTKLGDKIKALFLSLNTHAVGGVGIGTGLLSVGAILAQNTLDKSLPGYHLAAFVPVVDFYAQNLAAPVLATALGAAYFGRPKTVPHED